MSEHEVNGGNILWVAQLHRQWRWPWVRRSVAEEAQHQYRGMWLEALNALDGARQERDTAQAQNLALRQICDRNAADMTEIAEAMADLQSRYNALALAAIKAAEPLLPTVTRQLDAAIRAKATGRNHKAALWDWVRKQKQAGRSEADLSGAVTDGEADAELLVEQERV